ncbi:MAG: hypothetical protein J7J01_00960 [Methanophagales archaeon]|nr:hypothetical protein [Methanophagales archaeon]
MSGEEFGDVRAIALIRLAKEFQYAYEHWIWTYAKLRSHQKTKRLLEQFESDCQVRGWKLSETLKEDIRREIEAQDHHIKGALGELCRYYAHLRRLEREISKVLDWCWNWRSGFGVDADAEWESNRCSECSE